MGWRQATGPALFTSGVTSDNGGGFNSVAFSTGGAAVTNGQDYVLFLSISELYAVNNGAGMGVLPAWMLLICRWRFLLVQRRRQFLPH